MNADTSCSELATRWLTSWSSASSRAFEARSASSARVFSRLERDGVERAGEGAGQQVEEVLADRLDDIVERAGLQRGDSDAALLGAGDIDDRRDDRQRAQRFERRQPVEARHVMIDRDQVEARRGGERDPVGPAGRDADVVAATAERSRDQPAQAGVVVDVQDARRGAHPSPTSGTWMTDRNSPSC